MLRSVGDCNFADGFFDLGLGVGSMIKNGADPFHFIRENSNGDFWIGNFECVCSDYSEKDGIEARQFIISPHVCNHVNHLNFYGIANNHVMQHGVKAYQRMVRFFDEKGIKYAGSREKPSAVFEHQGKSCAIVVFSLRPENYSMPPQYWSNPEYDNVRAELLKNQECDFRIVCVHWGVEFISYPYNDQKQFAHFLIDSGADLVIGTHPHVMQGMEIYKGKHIFYSLGNCVFNMPWEPSKYSLEVIVDLSSNAVTYRYLHIDKGCFPVYAEVVPECYTMKYLNSLIGISEDNEKYFAKATMLLEQYRKANRRNFIKNVWKMKCSDVTSLAVDYLKRKKIV